MKYKVTTDWDRKGPKIMKDDPSYEFLYNLFESAYNDNMSLNDIIKSFQDANGLPDL